MTYTGYQLLWFFLIYSFMGWCGEVAVSVIKQHKFVNRGFVTGPLCPIYGMGAFAFAIFLPDLKNDWIFLFLGSMILASFIEYITGKCLTAITGKMWWDYSDFSFVGSLRCVCHQDGKRTADSPDPSASETNRLDLCLDVTWYSDCRLSWILYRHIRTP